MRTICSYKGSLTVTYFGRVLLKVGTERVFWISGGIQFHNFKPDMLKLRCLLSRQVWFWVVFGWELFLLPRWKKHIIWFIG